MKEEHKEILFSRSVERVLNQVILYLDEYWQTTKGDMGGIEQTINNLKDMKPIISKLWSDKQEQIRSHKE